MGGYLTQTRLNETVRRHGQTFRETDVVLAFAYLTTRQPCVARDVNAQASG